jgi:hypothetical protein
LELVGSQWEYVLRIERGEMILGQERLGRREKLFQGSVDVGASWNRLVELVAQSEKRGAPNLSR